MSGASRVLVTGGTGFLGRFVVRRLTAAGYQVRVLARDLARAEAARRLGAEVLQGDVADEPSFSRAISDCDRVVHLAAGTSGGEADMRAATVQGTRSLLALCAQHRVQRLVYISSCSVYGVADCAADARVTETTPLERFPERRGSYTASKLEAEGFVTQFVRAGTVPTVILRPGTIYGPGGPIFSPMMGFARGSTYIVIGMGGFRLPVVYVDNLVDAIVLSMEREEAVGQVFNVVDPEPMDKGEYIERVVRRVDPAARVLYVPYRLVYAATWVQERAFGLMRRSPVLSCYRLTSSQKNVHYDSDLIARRLGWRSNISVVEATERVVAAELSRRGKGSGAVGAVPDDLAPAVSRHSAESDPVH